MLRKRWISVLVVVGLLATAGMTAAQSGVDLPGSGWLTGQQIQNVGTGPANIAAEVYVAGAVGSPFPADESLVTGGLTGVPVGESRNILDSMWAGAPTSFRGAAVVSSDQAIVAIVNVAKAGYAAAAQYQGVGAPDMTIGFPLWKYHFGTSEANYKETTFFVQNAGSAAAVITAQFKADDGTVYTWTSGLVPAGEMVVISPADARSSTSVAPPTRTKGGLTVTCVQPIAGVVLEHGYLDETVLQAAKGFSPAEYATELVAPIIKRQFGGVQKRSTGLQVQNVSEKPVNITVEYTEAGLSANPGTTYTQGAVNIPSGASFTFFENMKDSGDDIPTGVLAAAVVTAVYADGSGPANIAAIVNETKYPVAQPQPLAQTTYGAIPTVAGTTEIGVPLVKEVFGAVGKRNSTGIQVMNVGAEAAQVVVTYSFGGATYTIQGVTIDPGASETFYRVSVSLPTGGSWVGATLPTGQFGGATITTANAQPIVAIVQETSLDGHQDNKNYEGFNLQ